VPEGERTAIEHELALITELRYEPYFLTVQDIVAYARRQGILCQGRGSAANSRVCYCLGVTSVDPQRGTALLFERFISRERNEPPDIDIDFEHERRGRCCSTSTASTVVNAPRSPPRSSHTARAARCATSPGPLVWAPPRAAGSRKSCNGGWSAAIPQRVRDAGFDPGSPWLARLLPLANELVSFPGFPRHLSQHVGGFVISEGCSRAGAHRERGHARAHRGAVG